MLSEFNADLYPKEVIIKTAYFFTDKCYVHLDLSDNKYQIMLNSKSNESDESMEKRLNNEIINQLARYMVSVKTSEIRQLIMGRAFASSMIVNKKDIPEYKSDYIPKAESILKDWFEIHDK